MTKTEKILSYHGIRPTQMRLEIYKFLKRKQSAVSFSDLKKAFVQKSETNKTANRTTFYRNLKIFEDKGLIHRLMMGSEWQNMRFLMKTLKANTVRIYICTFIVPIVRKQSVCQIKYRKKACQTIMK